MSGRKINVLVWLLLLFPVPCRGEAVYVNNITGDDLASGLLPGIETLRDGPVATLGRAFELARRGDWIVVANTGIPYSESAVLARPELSGSDRFPFVIEGNGAVLRGARPLPPDVWRPTVGGVYRYQPYRKGHYQLLVAGAPATEVQVDSAADTPPPLEPLAWCAVRGFVYFRVEPNRLIDDYLLEAPRFDIGLGIHSMRNVVVRDLTIESFRLDGVHVSGNSRNVRLLNIRSAANGRAGLAVSGTSEVSQGGLDLAGNRVADKLVLVRGRLTDLPADQVAPPPAPMSWDLESGRYVRILAPKLETVPATAGRSATPAVR